MIIHTVKSGETLNSIALLYGLKTTYLQNINLLPNPDNLVVGQNILILFPKTVHTVKPNDTLFSIAEQYSVCVNTILKNNPYISTGSYIYEGEEIVIEFDEERPRHVITNGYAYGNISDQKLRLALPYLTFISPFTYGILPSAELIPPDIENILNKSVFYPSKTLMHISTITKSGTFTIEAATEIFNNSSLWNTFYENILSEIQYYGYAGIDIDFEFINPSDSLKYAELTAFLKNKLNPLGYIVIAALAPKTSADQKGILYEGHNYFAIGKSSNLSFVMTYEWGYTYGPPMAVAPIESVKKVLDYAVVEISSNRILMGIPTYGYDWIVPYNPEEKTAAKSISNSEAILTALKYKAEIKYDSFSQSPYFYYTDESFISHEVWFDDAKSVLSKLRLIEMYNLAGCGYWNLERPFVQNYMILNNLYEISEYN